jgi:anti-sigma B factor antagonist
MSTFGISTPTSGVTVVSFPASVIGGPEAVELTNLLRDLASPRAVVFDLSQVTVMNSSGLGMLVSSLTTLKRANVSLTLASVPEKVGSLLTMTQLAAVFTTADTVETALSAL